MKVYYSDRFTLPLPEGHRFPIQKYTLLRQRVISDGVISNGDALVPAPATLDQLRLVHSREYVRRVVQGELTEKEIRRMGFPWSPGLVERSRRSVGGTIAACRSALADGVSANLAGGTHHAFRDRGEGYCVFNDCAVAARAMQAEKRVQKVLILDCDVHQGNGTAAIFADDPSVFTFSIHGAKNYPFRKELSDLDIALPDGCQDEQYLEALQYGIERSLALAKADLAIYLAGADPFIDDRLGRLALSKSGLAERDRLVYSKCAHAGIPIAVTMSGGYARQIDDTVDIHYKTIQLASQVVVMLH
jgi:acetoin utilization deacetylase AcuC-like enzyme